MLAGRKHGFVDGLIRNSVGLEDYEDLRADFISALDQIRESEAYFRRRGAAAQSTNLGPKREVELGAHSCDAVHRTGSVA
jgi:Cys/Met metabolism PLP-dependent enzyme